ncbi:hypothetical protein C5167_012896 [Papaver somniferum]|uniref:Uncharacterized protein n=1 Tax=Papaver somniferum TaxID=3469 RepID=A0A4Y7J249_PAPSO|nr:hypothetical protein C5167_012896 [Papaver somniferum]
MKALENQIKSDCGRNSMHCLAFLTHYLAHHFRSQGYRPRIKIKETINVVSFGDFVGCWELHLRKSGRELVP